jgi:uncharacterized protein (DUF983 family)
MLDTTPEIPPPAEAAPRDTWTAFRRGWSKRCPACGKGPLYRATLKVADACPACGEELHHQRADDAPAYFTLFIVGHVVVAGILMLEKRYAPETWIHLLIWLPLAIGMSVWLLPRIKGALVGLQWALKMHGFDPSAHHNPDLGAAPEGARKLG